MGFQEGLSYNKDPADGPWLKIADVIVTKGSYDIDTLGRTKCGKEASGEMELVDTLMAGFENCEK
jgi:hypothetical protein